PSPPPRPSSRSGRAPSRRPSRRWGCCRAGEAPRPGTSLRRTRPVVAPSPTRTATRRAPRAPRPCTPATPATRPTWTVTATASAASSRRRPGNSLGSFPEPARDQDLLEQVGTVGDQPVDPQVDQLLHLGRVVDGPHVHLLAEGGRGGEGRVGDDRHAALSDGLLQ